MTLSTLRAAFLDARVRAVMVARFSDDAATKNVCRYCGRFYRAYAPRPADGHWQCSVTPEFIDAVAALWWHSPNVSERQIAEICGVPISAARRWTRREERAA